MAPRSEEEKRRRKLEYLERKASRKAAKEQEQKGEEGKKADTQVVDATNADAYGTDNNPNSSRCFMIELPDDSLQQILCYLPARELGAAVMTCRALNYMLSECRVPHLLSRLRTKRSPRGLEKSNLGLIADIRMCANEIEARVSSRWLHLDTS